MAGQSVENKTGKKCNCCGKEFNKQSFTIPISSKENGFIVKLLVCGDCHHEHYKKGEQ